MSRSSSSSPRENEATVQDAETEQLKERVRELEQRNEELSAEASASPQDTTSLEEELEAERERVAELRAELNQTTDSLEHAEGELAAREARIETLEKQVDRRFSDETITAAEHVMNDIRDAVVYIRTTSGNVGSHGTGWFLNENTVVTNAHVIADALNNGFSLEMYTLGRTELSLDSMVGYVRSEDRFQPDGSSDDLAIFSVDGVAPNTLTLGSTSTLEDNQPLLQVGNPGSIGNWVGSLGRYQRNTSTSDLSLEIPIDSGNSGSPVVTLDGEVVGCTWGTTVNNPMFNSQNEPAVGPSKLHTEFNYLDAITAHAVPSEKIEDYYSEWS